ncbi:MAG: hypothetical protein J5742_02935 [Alphaproteobacteria bacterium]|nr:hypothetical protein [Alphaproteobacteria bacterium]
MTEPNGMTYMTEQELKMLPQIKGYPALVAHMDCPSEEFLLAAVFENPYIIRFVHNQSFMLRMLAVKLDYKMLEYVNGKTPEIMRAAAKHNDRRIMGADLTRDELELYANAQNIKKHGFKLRNQMQK